MDPSLRVITLQWVNNQMAGDELLELWKRIAGVWSLVVSIPVSSTPEQTHDFSGAPGVAYRFQLRARRGGTYRSDYQSANPDDWPSGSLLAHTAGLPKPTLTYTGWTRTSAIAQFLHFSFANVDPARPTRLRMSTDGGASFATVATVGAGTATYDYPIGAEAATEVIFYADQLDDDAVATNPGDHLTVYAGPLAPTDLIQVAPNPAFYAYTAHWTVNQPGAKTRISDHYDGVYTNRSLTSAGDTDGTVSGLPKSSIHISNGNVNVPVFVRVRHEITSFTVTDVSAWSFDTTFYTDIASDETLYFGP